MEGIWRAAYQGDVGEVERLVGQDSGLLDAADQYGRTPLMLASQGGHVGVVRWLMDEGSRVDERNEKGDTALILACFVGRPSVVRLLVERGADLAIATPRGLTPLMIASHRGHLEAVRVLLHHPSARATVDHRYVDGRTALWQACFIGQGEVVRALLESGADPTIADNEGTTPMGVAKEAVPAESEAISAEGRRECVTALEVRWCLPVFLPSIPCESDRQGLRYFLWHGHRRQSGHFCCGRPGRWPTSRGAARWRWRGGRRGRRQRRGGRWWTGWCTASRGTCSRISWR
jgi:hypothetical protein